MTGLKVIDGTPTAISKYLREKKWININFHLKKQNVVGVNVTMKQNAQLEII